MILKAALSEKNEENARLLMLNHFGHAEILLYPFCGIVKEGIALVKYAAY